MAFEKDPSLDLVSLTRCNYEPIVILGLNRSEAGTLFVVSVVFWLPTVIAFMAVAGNWMHGVPLAMAMVVVTMVLGGSQLRKVKRQRPEGYYQLYMRLRAEDFNLTSTGLIRRSGVWDIRRHGSKAEQLSNPVMKQLAKWFG